MYPNCFCHNPYRNYNLSIINQTFRGYDLCSQKGKEIIPELVLLTPSHKEIQLAPPTKAHCMTKWRISTVQVNENFSWRRNRFNLQKKDEVSLKARRCIKAGWLGCLDWSINNCLKKSWKYALTNNYNNYLIRWSEASMDNMQ